MIIKSEIRVSNYDLACAIIESIFGGEYNPQIHDGLVAKDDGIYDQGGWKRCSGADNAVLYRAAQVLMKKIDDEYEYF